MELPQPPSRDTVPLSLSLFEFLNTDSLKVNKAYCSYPDFVFCQIEGVHKTKKGLKIN
jgi:hypothetical protein